LPLQYGVLDLLGTPDEPRPIFKKRKIAKFEDIPGYKAETGTIFPNQEQRRADKVEIEITTIRNGKPTGKSPEPERIVTDPNTATATLVPSDEGGFHIHYRFRKARGCWLLFGMSDRSN